MPYFRCDRCELRLYSAASETRCSECSTPLGKAEQLLDATPLAQPVYYRRPISWAQRLPVDEGSAG
jgi:hypothetical protein